MAMGSKRNMKSMDQASRLWATVETPWCRFQHEAQDHFTGDDEFSLGADGPRMTCASKFIWSDLQNYNSSLTRSFGRMYVDGS